MTHYSKEDLYNKFASLVPSFAARCHLFCGHFFTPEINNKMKQNKSTIVYRNYPIHLEKKTSTYKENKVNDDKKRSTGLRENITQPPRPRCSA
jgi:hypothetical protein